jgi:hypothetical protein
MADLQCPREVSHLPLKTSEQITPILAAHFDGSAFVTTGLPPEIVCERVVF